MTEQQVHGPGSDLDVRPDVEVEHAVFDAELVDAAEQPRPGRRVVRGTAQVVTNISRSGPVAVRVAQRGALQTTRGAWVAGQGGVSWVHRLASALTYGHYREQIRLARLAGDREALADWTERLERAKDARARRLRELPRVVLSVLIAVAIGTTVVWALALAGGITVWASPGGLTWEDWWGGVGAVLGVLTTVAQVAATAAAGGIGPLLLFLAWREGKRVAEPPPWLLTPAEKALAGDAEITPSKVVTALRDLGIAKLRTAIKEMGDAGAGMLSLIRLAGCGVEVDVLLPSGVSTDEIQKRRRKLAENLDRHEYEVFITVVAARTVRLWIADSGALDQPIGLSPLVIDQDMTADLYTGSAPWGEDLRGDALALPLKQRHLLVTGLSNQGKALAVDTPIPTPSGWTTMGELQVGDQVFGINGKPCNVTGAFDIMHDHPCFEVEFSDGTVIVADAEHLWYTETAVSRRSERAQRGRPIEPMARGSDQRWKREMASVKTTAEIADTLRHRTAARDEANHSIPLAAPLDLPGLALPLNPYLFGYWLGDGRSDSARITCGSEDLAHVVSEIEGAGYYHRESQSRTCWMVTFSTHPIQIGGIGASATGALRRLGVLGDKHIPREYLRASEQQRRALLAGLLDSDGTIGRDGVVTFAVVSRRLADDTAELIQSLGFKVKRQVKRVNGRTEEHSTCYKVMFSPHQQVFRIKRKADRVRLGEQRLKSGRRYIVDARPVESVPVRCIAVDGPGHLFLASRAFIATHNTAAVRALALWAALDTSVELRIADLKGIGDWHMFDGLATVLIEGPTDEHVIAATEMLEEGVREMERRMAALDKTKYPNGVTRELARKPGSGFHPIELIVDEAQVAFMCPEVDEERRQYGGQTAKSRYFLAARKLHNQGRAVNVTLWQGTQDPTNQNLPKLVREGAHIRASLALGTEEQARMALGDKAIDGGAAPHQLRAGLDKGTLIVSGDGVPLPPGQASVTVRTHFIDGEDATRIAERAKERRKRRRRLTVVSAEPPIDHLADIHAALRGEPRVRTAVVLGRLIEHDPDTYEPWGFQDLAGELEREHVQIGKSDGQSVVRIKDVEDAMARRLVDLDGRPG